MRDEDKKDEDVKTQSKKYEATVLRFLDNEIAASSNPVTVPIGQLDDVDMLVDSLLKESITATGEQETHQDPEPDEVDLLFAKIFRAQKETPPQNSKEAPEQMDPGLMQTPSPEARPVNEVSTDLIPREDIAKPEPEGTPHEEESPHEEVTTPSMQVPFLLPLGHETGKNRPEQDFEIPESESPDVAPIPVFALAPSKPARNMQVYFICAAFLCLLAGTGIVYFTGFKKSAPPESSKPVSSATQTAPVRSELALPSQDLPVHATDVKEPPPPPPGHNAGLKNPADLETGNSAKTSVSAKEGKRAVSEPIAPPPAPSPATGAPTPAAAADKGTSPTPPATGAIAANMPPPVTQNTVQLAASTLPSPPSSALMQPIVGATSDLARLMSSSQPSLRPPAPLRTATPAVALTRVLPQYPAIARKTHATGTVVLDILIDEHGKVVKATPTGGPSIFYTEAVSAVLRWRFKPATLDGVNTSSSIQVSLVFKEQ